VSLERQCIAGAGLVQVNVELSCDKTPPRLNIVDVLQPPSDLDDSIGRLTSLLYLYVHRG